MSLDKAELMLAACRGLTKASNSPNILFEFGNGYKHHKIPFKELQNAQEVYDKLCDCTTCERMRLDIEKYQLWRNNLLASNYPKPLEE